jgi:hypothetical protein
MNPVRAGLVEDPAQYRWSSHRAYLGQEGFPWLTTDWVLSRFGHDVESARRSYLSFLTQAGAAVPRPEFYSGSNEDDRILGDDGFIASVQVLCESNHLERVTLQRIVAMVCGAYNVFLRDLQKPGKDRRAGEARAVAALLAREYPEISISELSRILNRDGSTLSCAATRLKERAKSDQQLAKRVEAIRIAVENNARMQGLTPS